MRNHSLRPARTAKLLLGSLLALASCQMATNQDWLPAVSLDGPKVPHAPVVAVKPAEPIAAPATQPSVPVPAPVVVAAPRVDPSVPADWLPLVPARPWQWIVIHHSATTFGNAAIIDKWHRDRGFDELGYHFVIGNGTNSGDGQIEVGPRWPKQKWGAHDNALDNRYNELGIGICLVGNFDIDHPTPAQLKSVSRLVAYLMKTYHIPADHVLGHGQTKVTDCPGKYMSVAAVRQAAEDILAASGENPDAKALASTDELIQAPIIK